MAKGSNRFVLFLLAAAALATVAAVVLHLKESGVFDRATTDSSDAASAKGSTPSTRPGTPKRRLVVPNGSTRVRVGQRSVQNIPGSSGKVLLEIGDITRGQVAATVHADGTTVLGPKSMKETDSAEFTIDGQRYRLTATALHNRLIGSDHAVFTVTEIQTRR